MCECGRNGKENYKIFLNCFCFASLLFHPELISGHKFPKSSRFRAVHGLSVRSKATLGYSFVIKTIFLFSHYSVNKLIIFFVFSRLPFFSVALPRNVIYVKTCRQNIILICIFIIFARKIRDLGP